MSKTVIRRLYVHRNAPPKPAEGDPCNGCGLCCTDTLCPAGLLLYRRRNGPCPALRWQDDPPRYLCGLLADAPRWKFRLLTRWISIGSGCDSGAEILDQEKDHTSKPPV